jgi:hypothetical protein
MDVSASWVLFVVHPPFARERDRRDNHDPRRRFPADSGRDAREACRRLW